MRRHPDRSRPSVPTDLAYAIVAPNARSQFWNNWSRSPGATTLVTCFTGVACPDLANRRGDSDKDTDHSKHSRLNRLDCDVPEYLKHEIVTLMKATRGWHGPPFLPIRHARVL